MTAYILRQTRRVTFLYVYGADDSVEVTAHNNRAAALAALGA
jgi:hypothetical protein